MRYAPEHNEATRERILEAASRLFREHGIAAVGLAKVMAEADLTVGTFYTHFKSKEALLRETLLRALRARHEELERALRAGHLEMALRAYLSPEHRDAPGTGCPVAALASEVARHPRATRQTFASQVEPSLDALAEGLSKRRGEKVGRPEAAALLGLLVGTLQLARATPDRAESGAILEAGIRAALRLAND
jgi:AcrR family transcriptional regulator